MISIVNYGMGNVQSILGAFQYMGIESRMIDTPAQILESNRLILPGVGSFAKAMGNIKKMDLLEPLNHAVLEQKVPILGICLGMQLFADSGEENGQCEGLGWIAGRVKKFGTVETLKIPHVGFNTSTFVERNKSLFQGLEEKADFYFVHSYVLECANENDISSRTEYGRNFVSSVQHDNIFGTQFHPEKSQYNGLTVLKNFSLV